MNGQSESVKVTATGTQVLMKRDKECKGSIRFATEDEKAPVSNVYVSRAFPGVEQAQQIFVTVSLL